MRKLPMKLFQIYARLSRGKTLGARIVVIDDSDRVLLVRPGYIDGWTLPGGGVDKGETLREAAIRELREEAAIEPLEPLQFHGMYSNESDFPGDHVACYVLRKFHQHEFKPSYEIREACFFARNEFPAGLRAGSRARIAEVMEQAPVSDHWKP